MSRYRKVDPRIWNDEKFRALSNKGKLVFFMLLTHPAMTSLGAMRGTTAGLSEELGWPVEAFREAFADVLNQGMVEHDSKACLIALPNFVRYNQPESPNVVKAWVGALDLLPECELKSAVVQRAKEVAEGMPEGFGKAFRQVFEKGMPNPKQEQKQKQKKTPLPPEGEVAAGFERFWATWPSHQRKVAKAQCARKWETRGCEAITDAVIEALLAAMGSADWLKNGGEFIPAPLVWLNQSRWEAPVTPTAEEVRVARQQAATVSSDAAEKTRAELDAMSAHAAQLTPEDKAARIAHARAVAASFGRPSTPGAVDAPAPMEKINVDD